MSELDFSLPVSDNPRVYKDKLITFQNYYHRICEALVKASLDAEVVEAVVSYIRDKALLATKDEDLTNPLKIAKSKVEVEIEVTLVEDGERVQKKLTYHKAKLLLAQKKSKQFKLQKLLKELESAIQVCQFYPTRIA